MLSKVSKRLRRRSGRVEPPPVIEQREERREPVRCAPDLLRWSDFLEPFPPVAMGGYRRYYLNVGNQTFPESPTFCPVLSRQPQPSSSSKLPSKMPLFSPTAPSMISTKSERHSTTIVHELSRETITPRSPRPRVVSDVSTSPGSPMSLRRIRRQVLRTPSIERDFRSTMHTRHLSAPSTFSINFASSSSMDLLSHAAASAPSSYSSTSSSHSHVHCASTSSSSESGPITPLTLTPSTSMDSYTAGGIDINVKLDNVTIVGEDNLRIGIEGENRHICAGQDEGEMFLERLFQTVREVDPQKRPDSVASYNTANTEFELEHDNDVQMDGTG